MFTSAPDQVIVIHLRASKSGQLNFKITAACQMVHQLIVISSNVMGFKGKAPSHIQSDYLRLKNPVTQIDTLGCRGMRFELLVKATHIDGTVSSDTSGLTVKNATEVTIYISAATSFNGFDKCPDSAGKDEDKLAKNYLNEASKKSWQTLLATHLADYHRYFDRVKFHLALPIDNKNATLPTNQRLQEYSKEAKDPALETLYFQYGRYLLISCSRPGGVNANLQGIWNKELQPPWSSNFTTNVNAEMNYWPAEATNLSEMASPFIDFIKNSAITGKTTAKQFYHARGWAVHHNSDIWAVSNPVGDFGSGTPAAANWAMGSPWLSQHLWWHYEFTKDKKYLHDTAYPLMKGATQFCMDWLVAYNGYLVTAPSVSPENNFYDDNHQRNSVSIATTMDMSIIRDLFSNVINASEVLGEDKAFHDTLMAKKAKLFPLQIGKKGNIQEWYKDWEDPDPHHRPISHLFGLFPGQEILPFTTPEFAAAAKKTLELRGDGGTGWSLAWKINWWARLLDGNHAYSLIRDLLKFTGQTGINYGKGGGSYANLFDAHPPFQIDGNFGAVSGMTEMLLQSQNGEISLLPAMPDAWAEGTITGLRARGGFVIAINWKNKELISASISSMSGDSCKVRTLYPLKLNGVKFESKKTDHGYLTIFPTVKGKTYNLISTRSKKTKLKHFLLADKSLKLLIFSSSTSLGKVRNWTILEKERNLPSRNPPKHLYRMKKLALVILITFQLSNINAQDKWQASWITDPASQNNTNSWYCFRKDFPLEKVPLKALAKIAIDSKYWLWVNGTMVVFEGGLKRGPNPNDTYYDKVDISKYLNKGTNTIAILGWYFGKDGFSHVSSGKFGLIFECIAPEINVVSDNLWRVKQHPAYGTCPPPLPNFRLSESSINFDARNDIGNWFTNGYSVSEWENAKILGIPPVAPWNNLILRPIPQWKDSKLVSYIQTPAFPVQFDKDTTIICTLPSNLQITPYLKIETQEDGKAVEIKTENFMGGSQANVYARYISRKGIQEYESYGWMNGHKVIYKIPAHVKVLDLKYRETGYNTELAGSFTSSDDFLNRIWQKSLRTLYITMRDNYMDCPDRERAQWWGDEVNESGEAFYALDTVSHLLFKKGMYELINWQRKDSTLYAPIPAGNWDKELPVQMLTSVGYYGFWNYYLNTGDKQPISELYNGVRNYLKIWKWNDDGSIQFREGGWSWGDWGKDIDIQLISNGFYYLAIKGALKMAETLQLHKDVAEYRQSMERIKTVFNSKYWTGKAYRHPDYKEQTDDRCQAIAVVAGIADKEKYLALYDVFKKEEHSSPYMEKYVLEALFKMGYVDYAIERMKKRFGSMVNNPAYATLFEGWGIGKEGYGGGTTNHAWSGGALTILSQYLCGIEPIEPGYKLFQIIPNPGSIKAASATVQSVKGVIKSSFDNADNYFKLAVSIPKGTEAVLGVPSGKAFLVKLNSEIIWKKGKAIKNKVVSKYLGNVNNHVLFKVNAGNFILEATNDKK